jgi:hypothetical protein
MIKEIRSLHRKIKGSQQFKLNQFKAYNGSKLAFHTFYLVIEILK